MVQAAFEEAVANLMISRGSVALPQENKYGYTPKGYNLGSYYGSYIEGDPDATEKFYERLVNGARPVFAQCSYPDFGIEDRFNHTFTSTSLKVGYCAWQCYLDDGLEPNPITLVAGVDVDFYDQSFMRTLQQVSEFGTLTIEQAIDGLGERVTAPDPYGSRYALLMPKLF